MQPHLFEPLHIRGIRLRNRIGISPMCQYRARQGCAVPWHLVHYGARAVGGAGLVMVEATAVAPEGRISPGDLGLWDDACAAALAPVAAFIEDQGAVPGIQLAHAGRKASSRSPEQGNGWLAVADGGWEVFGPGREPFDPGAPAPSPLDGAGITRLVAAFTAAARRAVGAGFRLIEIHAAHGYLLHQFCSPLTNHRTDAWGGDPDRRMRLAVEVAAAVRAAIPPETALAVRISATDWVPGGWDPDQSAALVGLLAAEGVDLIDVSSGGIVPGVRIPVGPGYQCALAGGLRRRAGLPVAAVGMITDAAQAEGVLADGDADLVLIGRASLRDPHWPLNAAQALGAPAPWPPPYLRAAPAPAPAHAARG